MSKTSISAFQNLPPRFATLFIAIGSSPFIVLDHALFSTKKKVWMGLKSPKTYPWQLNPWKVYEKYQQKSKETRQNVKLRLRCWTSSVPKAEVQIWVILTPTTRPQNNKESTETSKRRDDISLRFLRFVIPIKQRKNWDWKIQPCFNFKAFERNVLPKHSFYSFAKINYASWI